MNDNKVQQTLKNWRSIVRKYQKPNTRKAIIQILNTFLPFIGIWVLMYFSLNWSYLITIGLGVVAAGFLVRIFIIQHDCGHHSFMKSKKANDVIGFISSLFSSIPYKYWSTTHNHHHAHNGMMEHRGIGDIYFLTTEEYEKKSKWGKFLYRTYRTPVVQFIVAPILYLGITLRIPFFRNLMKNWKQARWGYVFNNLAVAGLYVLLAVTLGWQKFLLIHIPVMLMFGIIAFWMFYVQHQHEDNYKEWKSDWDYLKASLQGSTYYKLPRVLQWFTGNIGFHHIHHLNCSIPNYNLELCAKENPVLNKFAAHLTLKDSIKCAQHRLWDEQQKRMITLREYLKRRRA